MTAEKETSQARTELSVMPIPMRKRIRDWWSDALLGKAQVSMPELARQAEQHFAKDPGFIAKFWDEFGYEVLYDTGINILSERRYMYGGDGGAIEGLEEWFERTSGGHVALSSASDEEWDTALERRETEIEIAQARVQALRDLRAGLPVVGVQGIAYDPRNHDEPPPIQIVGADETGEIQVLRRECTCPQCKNLIPRTSEDDIDAEDCINWCPNCTARYGTHLLKATVDPFDYAVRLTSGDLIYFAYASIDGDWVYLADQDIHRDDHHGMSPHPTPNPLFDRGLQIHLSAIAWCADAPFGS